MTHLAATEQLGRPQNIDFLSGRKCQHKHHFLLVLVLLFLHDGVNPGGADVDLLSGFWGLKHYPLHNRMITWYYGMITYKISGRPQNPRGPVSSHKKMGSGADTGPCVKAEFCSLVRPGIACFQWVEEGNSIPVPDILNS